MSATLPPIVTSSARADALGSRRSEGGLHPSAFVRAGDARTPRLRGVRGVPRLPLSPMSAGVWDGKRAEEEVESIEVPFPTPREPSNRRRWWCFGGLLVVVTLVNSTFSLLAPILPTEAERRGLTPLLTGLIFSIYSLCNFVASPLAGRLMQRRVVSRKVMLVAGLVLSAAASAGIGASVLVPPRRTGLWAALLLALRVLNGVGAAAVDTSSSAWVTHLFRDSEHFGTCLGLLESSLAVGWMVGPLAGGLLAALLGFSAPFYAAAVVGLLLVPLPFAIPENRDVIMLDVSSARDLTPARMLAQPRIALLLAGCAICSAAITFLDATLAPFLESQGVAQARVGACFALLAASYAVATTVAGWLSDRVGPLRVMVAGQLACVLPFLLLGPSPLLAPALRAAGLTGAWLIVLSLALLGAGCAFGLMPVLPAMLKAADEARLSPVGLEDLASGLLGGAYYLGAGAGPLLGGAATAAMGFAWAVTANAGLLLLLSCLLLASLGWERWRRRQLEEGAEPLLEAEAELEA